MLHLKGLNEKGTRENIKEVFDNFAKIKWVDYSKGEPEAYLRFTEANVAGDALAKALEARGGEIKIGDVKVDVRVLEGDEEETYWKNLIQKLIEARVNKKSRGKSRNFGGNNRSKPDYKNKNKRSHEDNDENGGDGDGEEADNGVEDLTKKQKVEAN